MTNHEGFHRFLLTSALTNAKQVNFTEVVNALLGRTSLRAGTPEFGDLFEHFIIAEVRAYISYRKHKAQMYYWRSTSKFEVDLILKTPTQMIAIEVKSKSNITARDCKGLIALAEDHPKAKKVVITPEGRHHIFWKTKWNASPSSSS